MSQENKVLKLGKITTRELAEWFGISYNTYRKQSLKKLDELENFCKFKQIYGGVDISEIYIDKYKKGLNDLDDKIYLKIVQETPNQLCSIAGIARELRGRYQDYADLSESQVRYRMRKAGIRGFGDAKNKQDTGIYGYRYFVWAIKESDFNEYRYMTEEEKNIFNELLGEQKEECARIALEADAYIAGEKTAEEFAASAMRIARNFYKNIILPFKKKTGKIIVRATQHTIIISRVNSILREMNLEELPLDLIPQEYHFDLEEKENESM